MAKEADVLIVIDMLNDFADKDGKLFVGENAGLLIPRIKMLMSKYRTSKKSIIFLCDEHIKNDKEFDRFDPHCIKGSWGAEIVPELRPRDSNNEYIVKKTRFSGFYNTKLDRLLKRLCPQSIEVCGLYTSICVMDTVGGLANRDYTTMINAKNVTDFSPTNHKQALVRMEMLYGIRLYGN